MVHRSRKPYLIRAIYDWAVDNGHTPHLLVAAEAKGVVVPRAYVREGRIALNISPMAIQHFDPSADPLFFSARFGGAPFDVEVPTGAVLAVYAQENGEGIVFGETEESPEPGPGDTGDSGTSSSSSRPSGRPNLRVVK